MNIKAWIKQQEEEIYNEIKEDMNPYMIWWWSNLLCRYEWGRAE